MASVCLPELQVNPAPLRLKPFKALDSQAFMALMILERMRGHAYTNVVDQVFGEG